MFDKKRILITGGAGFLGSNLCRHYLSQDNYVIAVDNLMTGRLCNINEFLNNKNFTFIKQDILEPINIHADWILNFACPASPPAYQRDPIHTTKTSVLGGLNMLELARKNNARIMQASTSEVYGDPEIHPQVEGYKGCVNTIGPRACYDEGKRCAESLFFDYKRAYDLDIKVIRIFNTYGPAMDPDDGRVVSNFIIQALKGEPLSMFGNGSQTRSFCFVDDLVAGIAKMMETKKGVTGPVNLGNPDEFTLIELADKVLKLTGSKSVLEFKPLPQDDPKMRRPDITLAKNLLGWQPFVDLDRGLVKTIEYFSKVMFTGTNGQKDLEYLSNP